MINDKVIPQLLSYHPKYLWLLMLSYAMIISISNWYDARLILLFGLTISPGALSFPFSFLLSDVITEIYGYKNARLAIWVALLFNVLFLIFGQIIINLPTPSFALENNTAFNKLLSINLWIVIGSFTSYLIAEPLNSYITAKLKIIAKGKYVGIRFITSTLAASLIDSILFIGIAFHNIITIEEMIKMMISIWLIKSIIEILGLPLSMRLTKWLKNTEKLDIYDINTNFNVFNLDIKYNVNNNYFTK